MPEGRPEDYEMPPRKGPSLEGKMDDLILEVMQTNETVEKTDKKSDSQKKSLSEVQKSSSELVQQGDARTELIRQSVDSLRALKHMMANQFQFLKQSQVQTVEAIQGDTLQKQEDAKEQNEVLEEIADNTKKENKGAKGEDLKFDEIGKGGIAAAIGAILGSLAIIPAAIVGMVQGLRTSFLKDLPKFLRSILKSVGLKKTATRVGLFFRTIREFFRNLRGNFIKAVGNTKTFIANIVQPVKNFFAGIGSRITGVFKGSGKVGKLLAPVTKAIDGIKAFFRPFSGLFSGPQIINVKAIFDPFKQFFQSLKKSAKIFTKVGSTLGRILGRIFLPISVIMAAIDGIRGGLDAAGKEEGFINKFIMGIGGAISGIIGNLIGLPLDLLKSGVAWILGKFGFDNAAESLKSFSFKELINKVIMTVAEALKKAVAKVRELFTGDNLKNAIKDLGQKILNSGPIQFLIETGEKIKAFFVGAFEKVKGFIRGISEKAKAFFLEVVDVPIGYITGVIDRIKGIFAGDENIVSKAIRGIAEIAYSVVTFPIGLLQSAIVKIGEFFGFDMSAIEDFDLAGKIKDLFALPANLIADAIENIKLLFSSEGREKLAGKAAAVGEVVKNFIKGILQKILPKPDSNKAWWSINNLSAAAVPKFVYDFAGMDKKTGRIIDPIQEVSAPVPNSQGAQMEQTITDTLDAKESQNQIVVDASSGPSSLNVTQQSVSYQDTPHIDSTTHALAAG
jgi:hypothetical protein